MNTAHLLLGSNLKDRDLSLSLARHFIAFRIGPLSAASSIFETEPWGFDVNDKFLNQAVVVQTELTATQLLETLTGIEIELGRIRSINNYESRTIDIDILFFEQDVIDTKDLTIPHPRMQNRLFALMPLNEIAGDFMHPVLKKSVSELLSECKDDNQVEMLNKYKLSKVRAYES